MSTHYDICIVGAGMFGSAAARHVTQINQNSKVCVIGPEAPKERNLDDHVTMFGAYYDTCRVARQSDLDPSWSVLSSRSMSRYRDLERQAGISFYAETGCLFVAPPTDPFIVNSSAAISKASVPAATGKWSELKSAYNLQYLNFDDGDQAVIEHVWSGYINPRRHVEAELLVARKRGCDVIRDVVDGITEIVRDGLSLFDIQTNSGRKFLAKKVLLATGASAPFCNLLPSGFKPSLHLVPVSVVHAELNEDDRKRYG